MDEKNGINFTVRDKVYGDVRLNICGLPMHLRLVPYDFTRESEVELWALEHVDKENKTHKERILPVIYRLFPQRSIYITPTGRGFRLKNNIQRRKNFSDYVVLSSGADLRDLPLEAQALFREFLNYWLSEPEVEGFWTPEGQKIDITPIPLI